MGFAISELGVWSPDGRFEVEAERTKAFATATNDPLPAHTGGELAPPVFSIVPIWDTMGATVARVVPAEVLMLVVHGEQDMRWTRPVRPGDVLTSRAAPVGVHSKPSGTAVVIRIETRDEVGELVVEQYTTVFFRGVSEGESAGDEAPGHRLSAEVKAQEPIAVVSQTFDDDQTYRYSEASGDLMPIHLDDEFARQVGLPGIIIHGMCTMAFTSWAAIQALAAGDPARLRRFVVRFSKPVLPGETITTRFWTVARGDAVTTYGFETTNPDGAVVVKDGLAEIGD